MPCSCNLFLKPGFCSEEPKNGTQNKVKGSTGSKFIRETMKQKKKSAHTQEGLLKEEAPKASEKEASIGYREGTFQERVSNYAAAEPGYGPGGLFQGVGV